MAPGFKISFAALACFWPLAGHADEAPFTAIDLANADSPAPAVPSTFRDAVPDEYQFEFDASLTSADEKRVAAEANSADRFDRAVGDWNQVRVGRRPQLKSGVVYQPIPSARTVDQPRPSGGQPQSPVVRRTIAICAAGLSLAAWLIIALRSLKSTRTAPPQLS
jgi:hypothetical protein